MTKTMKHELEKYVGKTATVNVGGLTVQVIIKDFKTSYGRERYLVSPIAGTGEVWTEKVEIK